MNNELVIQNSEMSLSANDIIAQKKSIQHVMKSVMIQDVHYGVIPGCPKPSLYQPGAEVLAMTFRLAPSYIVEDIGVAGEFAVRATCTITTTSGIFLGSACGQASTSETKYAWRSSVCDGEFDSTPENMRRELWKRDGSRTKQVRTNPADLANTITKMAQKRAFVAAIRQVTAAGDIFAQDLEDLQGVADIESGEPAREPIKKPQAKKPVTSDGQLGTVTDISQKSGRKASGDEWTCYFVEIDGERYATFDTTLGASLISGMTVKFMWKQGDKGKQLLEATPVSEVSE